MILKNMKEVKFMSLRMSTHIMRETFQLGQVSWGKNTIANSGWRTWEKERGDHLFDEVHCHLAIGTSTENNLDTSIRDALDVFL
jgi:hypothetical protein